MSYYIRTKHLHKLIKLLLIISVLIPKLSLAINLPHDKNGKIQQLNGLSDKFNENKDYYLSDKFNENKTREVFIDKFYEILGWDIDNSKENQLYAQDSIPEARMKLIQTIKYVDYAHRLDGRAVFFTEAKAANKKIDNPDYIFQSKRYAWSSGRANIVILTDYEDMRVYDARIKPDYNKPEQGEIKELRLHYKDYAKNFKLLWNTFSKEAIEGGSLSKLLRKSNKELERTPMENKLVKDLEELRLKLAQDIYKHNKIDEKELSEASQNILNKILFARILEDRDITPTKRMYYAISNYNQDKSLSMEDKGKYLKAEKVRPAAKTLFLELQKEFKHLSKRYHGIMFKDHFSNKLEVSNEILQEIITELYGDKSAYDFSVVPMHVIGKAYETYLGKTITIEDGKVEIRERPEVKSSGGVFYTPKWVADYMVSQTLGEKLKGKNISVLKEIKVLDPACGSGVFPASIANKLFSFAEDYYNQNPSKIGGTKEFPDAIKLENGSYVLSAKKRAEIIEDSIYCTDIDAQAIENTKMWLYILMLEHSGSYIADQERKYKIPNKVKLAKNEKFKLPDLDKNIVNANALIGTDFGNKEENEEVKAYDWNTGKIGDIVKNGGFDIIIGNPPYIRHTKMKKHFSKKLDYLQKIYKTMNLMQADLYFGFYEKGISILKDNGLMSYITSDAILQGESASLLREELAPYTKKIINFTSNLIFENVGINSAILVLQNSKNNTAEYYQINKSKDLEQDTVDTKPYEVKNKKLLKQKWIFDTTGFIEKFEHINTTLGDVANIFSGQSTGADKVFILENGLPEKLKLEKSCLRVWLKTTDIKRYQSIKESHWLILPYYKDKLMSESFFKELCPNSYNYLKNHLTTLKKRSCIKNGKEWYDIQSNRNYEKTMSPKIIVNGFNNKQQFSIDKKGGKFFLSGFVYGIAANSDNFSNEMLLGLLNSSLINRYSKAKYRKGKIMLVGDYKNIPIPEYNSTSTPIYKKIEHLVKAIYDLDVMDNNEAAKIELERQIDELVEQLYGIKQSAVILQFPNRINLIEYSLNMVA